MSSIEAMDFIVSEKEAGQSYHFIKEELNKAGFSASEIKSMIQEADEEILDQIQSNLNTLSNSSKRYLGLTLIILGVVFSFISFITHRSLSWPVFIWHGPILYGLFILFAPKVRLIKKTNTFSERKKRRFHRRN